MLKQFGEWVKFVWTMAQDFHAIKAEQTEMRRDLRAVQDVLQRMLIEWEKDREIWDKDKRILMLELQAELNKLERRLPPKRED